MTIALIGYRGTGKTTVACLLAQRLGWEWVDADVEIERRAGRTIQQIFAADGEPAFRDWEEAVVGELAARENTVLALGGGAVLREANRVAISQLTVVWLSAVPETIYSRIAADTKTAAQRPNLTTQGGLPEIQRLLAQREPLYRDCADYIVDTEGKSPAQVADEIVCLLRVPG